MNNFDTIKFIDGDFEMVVNVSLEDSNIWLTVNQICSLFGRNKSTISRHIKNILENNNLVVEEIATKVIKNATKHEQISHRPSTLYNLETILRIGEKIKSDRGLKLKELLEQYLKEKFGENNEVIIYNNGSLNIDVKISPKEDTVYLNQNQIAELFDTTQQNVSFHIKNIVEEGELSIEATHKYFLLVQHEGDRLTKRNIEHFNLDMILSIGYRVKSKNAINFRKWVSTTMKQYMLKGYVLNNDRISISVDNFIQLENDISHIKDEIKEIKQEVFIEPLKDRIIDQGQVYDAHEYLTRLFDKAKKSIVIIDPYFDITGLNYLRLLDKNIVKTVILSNKSTLNEVDISLFKEQYGQLNIVKTNNFHDRYLRDYLFFGFIF